MWAKISDDFFRHPRTVAAGRDARDLFLVSLTHCNEHLTDGFVAAGYLRRLAADAEIDDARAAADRLVAVGYWEECDGGWMVHDFLDYNPSRAEVLAEREKAAIRKERWKNGARNGVRNAVPNGEGTGSPVPVPVPDKETTSSSPPSARIETPHDPTPNEEEADGHARFPDGAPWPISVQEALAKCPPHWEAELRLLVETTQIRGTLTQFALGVIRRWRRGEDPPATPPPAPPPPQDRAPLRPAPPALRPIRSDAPILTMPEEPRLRSFGEETPCNPS